MQIYILDKNYEMLGVIDEQEDIVFLKCFNDVGYCALKVSCNEEMLNLLKSGHYIYRFDDDMLCRIETPEIDTHVEQGDYLTVTATDMNNILAGRIVRWAVVYSGTVAGFIKRLIVENIINPAQAARKISNFEFDDSNFAEFTEKINVGKDTAAQDLLQLVMATCKAYNYGFRVSYNINTRKLVFRLLRGANKAKTTSAQYIEFSPNFSNIISSYYKEDESNYKNIAYVGYKSADKDDENIYLLSVHNEASEPTGEARRETYVDGSSTSRDITLEELQTLFATVTKEGTTYYATVNGAKTAVATSEGQGEEEKLTVTDYTYLLLIRNLGENALADHTKTQEFNGEVDTIDTYEYKKDYNLGDIVKVKNEYGIEAEAQITEVTESESADNAYAVEPKFEYIY